MAAPQASSRLEMLQARFQQKQLQEKEQKLLQLYDQQQQRAYQVVQRSSAGSNASNQGSSSVRTTSTTHTTSTSQGGKVRQMFDERRHTTVKGIDRSYPLEPLENKLRNKQTNANGVSATQKNGNLNRQSVSMKRMTRADVNSNVNGGKPVVSYHEEITRESFGPFVRRYDDEGEPGIENRVANGYRHDADDEDEALDQEAMERNRMMAKIHLMGFDETLKHRVRNDLDSEEFPEYLMVDVPDKLPKKNLTKKLSQAEARLERFKNTMAKKTNVSKQPISTSTVIKKRSDQMEPARSNFQNTKSPSPDVAARKQNETNATRTTRGNILSSPVKSPDNTASRRVLTDSKNHETKSSKKSGVAKGADSIGSKAATIAATVDVADGVVLQNDSPYESATKKPNAFVIGSDDQPSKESDTVPSKKPPVRKPSSDQQTCRGSDRPISSSSSSGTSSQSPASNTKAKRATKTSNSSGPQTKKLFSTKSSGSNMDNLATCNICKRNFAQDRIGYHETICAKTSSKKRKQFNMKVIRIKGTELEPFVKEGFDKKQELKMKKQEVKSDWRRKHEDFINTIRYAKQVQAHVAAGGNANDISPPPPSDTSDYIQCPHCGRKFNQAAAERHIPKCENMRHNKPALSRAARPRR